MLTAREIQEIVTQTVRAVLASSAAEELPTEGGFDGALLCGMGPGGKPEALRQDAQKRRGVAVSIRGRALRSGSGAPADTLGEEGEYYLDTSSGIIYKKSAGTW